MLSSGFQALRNSSFLQVFAKDEAFYGKLTSAASTKPLATATYGRVLHQRLINSALKYQQNVSTATSAEELKKQLDYIRPRYDRYSLHVPGLTCPQAEDDRACSKPASVTHGGFCQSHSMDARECCEDIIDTYEAYTATLKKWVRLGTPATLRRCRELHNKIQEELVGGIPLTKSNPKVWSAVSNIWSSVSKAWFWLVWSAGSEVCLLVT